MLDGRFYNTIVRQANESMGGYQVYEGLLKLLEISVGGVNQKTERNERKDLKEAKAQKGL